MIAKAYQANNPRQAVVHRFHKRESCVFHSIHRLTSSLEPALPKMCDGASDRIAGRYHAHARQGSQGTFTPASSCH